MGALSTEESEALSTVVSAALSSAEASAEASAAGAAAGSLEQAAGIGRPSVPRGFWGSGRRNKASAQYDEGGIRAHPARVAASLSGNLVFVALVVVEPEEAGLGLVEVIVVEGEGRAVHAGGGREEDPRGRHEYVAGR